jgi:hypothetical protein
LRDTPRSFGEEDLLVRVLQPHEEMGVIALLERGVAAEI